jgi:zinc protease
MASLLEEGAGSLDSRGFAERREELAASLRFEADADAIAVSARMLTSNRGEVVDLLRLALTEPVFDQPSIDRVRGQILSIIAANATSPDDIARERMDARIFGDHPYGSSDMGTVDSVRGLTRDDILAAKAATMARDRLYISAVGDITAEELGQLLDRLLSGLPGEGAPMPARVEARFDGETTVEAFDTPQSVVIFGQPGLRVADPDYFAAFVLNQIIGGSGFTARLMDEVREKRGLTYGISSSLVSLDRAESWMGSFSSSNDKVAEAIAVVRNVWSEAAASGVTQAELDAAKTYLTGSYPLRFDGNDTIARILVGMQMEGFPIDYPANRNKKVEAVTLDQVNRVARERLRPDLLTFMVVGQPEGVQGTH